MEIEIFDLSGLACWCLVCTKFVFGQLTEPTPSGCGLALAGLGLV